MEKLNQLADKPVYIYTHGLPGLTGSGSRVRHYTNIRAYRDLGFKVEVVHISRNQKEDRIREARRCVEEQLGCTWVTVEKEAEESTIDERAAYYLGFPFGKVLDVLFPTRRTIQREVLKREEKTPGAIHHFEYLDVASAAIGLESKVKTVWSCHDLQSVRYQSILAMRREIGNRVGWRQRAKSKHLPRAERAVLSACRLVLAIAEHERAVFMDEWGYDNAMLLPMSWPSEDVVVRERGWVEGGTLRLIHVGGIGDFVGYYSLAHIISEVLPLVSQKVLSNLEVLVVGRDSGSEYAARIKKMACNYPQVKFLGYVEDVDEVFASGDLQLVGAVEATGLRTRIVESFVKGLPVLTSHMSANGFWGVRDKENILIASSAQEFATHLEYIYANPQCLPQIAGSARELYFAQYSRKREAQVLADALRGFMIMKEAHMLNVPESTKV